MIRVPILLTLEIIHATRTQLRGQLQQFIETDDDVPLFMQTHDTFSYSQINFEEDFKEDCPDEQERNYFAINGSGRCASIHNCLEEFTNIIYRHLEYTIQFCGGKHENEIEFRDPCSIKQIRCYLGKLKDTNFSPKTGQHEQLIEKLKGLIQFFPITESEGYNFLHFMTKIKEKGKCVTDDVVSNDFKSIIGEVVNAIRLFENFDDVLPDQALLFGDQILYGVDTILKECLKDVPNIQEILNQVVNKIDKLETCLENEENLIDSSSHAAIVNDIGQLEVLKNTIEQNISCDHMHNLVVLIYRVDHIIENDIKKDVCDFSRI